MNLNSSQHEAVTYQNGPLLIIAGAGTGKTTVITERIKHLINAHGVNPQHIFAATFTQKAAGEMLERLDMVMPLGYQEPWLGTFHSLSEKLLRLEGLEIGLNPDFTVLTQTDQWLFLKKHVKNLGLHYYRPLGNPNKFISALVTFFSRLSDEDVNQSEFDQLIATISQDKNVDPQEVERLAELAKAYKNYTQLKYDSAVMDFGDLMVNTLKLFRQRPNILAKYQRYFKHLLVDEFQDTNYAQFELIKLLAPPETNPPLTVVGDDDQSVYRFRGASIVNVLDFKAIYPHAKEIVLTDNYRSNQAILDASYQVIKNNNPHRLEAKLGINKQLISRVSQSGAKNPPQIFEFATTDDEIDWTVEEIVKLVTQHSLQYQDIAILARANSHLEPYASSLKNAGLPYQLVSNRGLFDQEEIRDLIYFLSVIINPHDSVSLFPLTQLPLFKCDPALVFNLLSQAKRRSISLFEAMANETSESISRFIEVITTYQALAARQTVRQVLYRFVLDTGYVDQFIKDESVENQFKIKNLNLFFNKIKQFEASNLDRSTLNFLNTLELWLEAGENPGQAQIEDIDTIKLMTIHAAKGLEFDAVFVCSLISGRFPSSSKKDLIEVPDALIKETIPEGNMHIAEERRLFYVALTRAKKYLYLTYALDVGGARLRKPSGFVAETGLNKQINQPSLNLLPKLTSTKSPQAQTIHSGQYQINQLSYSKLDTFKSCPLRFKYRYLLQIPAKPHHTLSFGKSIHTALHLFHSEEMANKKPNLETLLQLYTEHFEEEGYESSDHKKERFEAGKKSLTKYYSDYKQLLGRPVMLEQSFKLKIDGISFIGKIDRIDQNEAGEYEIIDYKTGTSKDQKTVDRDEQLTLYALAAKEAFNIEPSSLSLYFLEENGGKVTTTRNQKQLEKAKDKLHHQIKELRESTFPPKPSEFSCKYCEYVRLCPFAVRK